MTDERKIVALANSLNSVSAELNNVIKNLNDALLRTEASSRSILVLQKAIIDEVNKDVMSDSTLLQDK